MTGCLRCLLKSPSFKPAKPQTTQCLAPITAAKSFLPREGHCCHSLRGLQCALSPSPLILHAVLPFRWTSAAPMDLDLLIAGFPDQPTAARFLPSDVRDPRLAKHGAKNC